MLRLAEPLLSSRIGGWALVESPPQRTAVTGQQWSLLIVTTAALVAMLAVVFDLRLSSDGAALMEQPAATTVESPRAEARTPATVPPPTTSERQRSEASSLAALADAPTSAAEGSSQRTVLTSPARPIEAEQGAAAATDESTETVTDTRQVEAVSTDAAASETSSKAAALDDPASRIRDYLGLHAAAQLPVSFTYEVQPGDTASSIATRFGLEEATVLFNNFDIHDPNRLSIGQKLMLPPVDGLVYTVQLGDRLDALLQNFQADLEATLAFRANGISSPDQIFVGRQVLLVHGSASVASGSLSSERSGQNAQVWTEPQFVLYLRYEKITDYFGTARGNAIGYHTGVDYIAPVGELVGAAAAGVVSVATWDPLYGNWVEIDHGGGYRSRYAHLDVINVREGQWVDAGNYIGTVGNTGNSSGAHLHFEIIVNGQAVNPLAWLN